MAAGPLRILFVCAADFAGPTEKQFLGFARELIDTGHEVMMSITGPVAEAIPGVVVERRAFRGPRLRKSDLEAVRAFSPTVVHALNARLPVAVAARTFARATGAPAFVHFEDDEWGLASGRREEPWPRRTARRMARLAAPLHPPLWPFSTAGTLRWAASAAGLDALTPALAEHVRERLGRDCAVVPPAYRPPTDGTQANPPAAIAHLRDHQLVVYTGALFGAHEGDVRLGMRAIAELQASGRRVAFVYTGHAAPRFDVQQMAGEEGIVPGTAHDLGYVEPEAHDGLLRAATVLIQPGRPSEFNRLRLPGKLAWYLSSGTPTVTFATGFGELLVDREEVLKTHSGDHRELADRIAEVLDDSELRERLGRGGQRAAARLFDPVRNTNALIAYYRGHLR